MPKPRKSPRNTDGPPANEKGRSVRALRPFFVSATISAVGQTMPKSRSQNDGWCIGWILPYFIMRSVASVCERGVVQLSGRLLRKGMLDIGQLLTTARVCTMTRKMHVS